MAKVDGPRIAVLGAGPIGLEAALYARYLHYPTVVYERRDVAANVREWGYVRLFSPFGMNVTPLGRATVERENLGHEFPADGDCITGRDYVMAYLQPLSSCRKVEGCLRLGCEVVAISRKSYLKEDFPGDQRRGQAPFRILFRDREGKEHLDEADIVLDCTGTYGHHRWLGDGGIPALGEFAARDRIAYGLEDVLGDRQAHYAGKTVLVVGGGYSAATTVSHLALLAETHPETWVIWLARCQRTQPIKRIPNDPLRERDRLAVRANNLATRTDGNVEFHAPSLIERIETPGEHGFRVRVRCGNKERTWEVDRIIANVGYGPDNNLYRELQVHECYATFGPMKLAAALMQHSGGDCLTVPATAADTLRNPEPGFFILGSKSYGRNSNFLLRNGFHQVRDVFSLISGKANLDLYKSPPT